MSSLIADLESAPGSNDGDFVQSILNEMNGGSGGGGGMAVPTSAPVQQLPAPTAYQSQGSVIMAPNPNTMAPHVMDNGPATAHMIGNSYPTPADFAQMMSTSGGGGGGAGGAAGHIMAAPQGGDGVAGSAAVYAPAANQRAYVPTAPKKSWMAKLIGEFRISFSVVILVFVFSLPVINFLFAHYLPRMVKPTGELTLPGLLVKSFAAGVAFWFLQKVVVPLLSLD